LAPVENKRRELNPQFQLVAPSLYARATGIDKSFMRLWEP